MANELAFILIGGQDTSNGWSIKFYGCKGNFRQKYTKVSAYLAFYESQWELQFFSKLSVSAEKICYNAHRGEGNCILFLARICLPSGQKANKNHKLSKSRQAEWIYHTPGRGGRKFPLFVRSPRERITKFAPPRARKTLRSTKRGQQIERV